MAVVDGRDLFRDARTYEPVREAVALRSVSAAPPRIPRPGPSFMIPDALAGSMVYSAAQSARVRRLLANQSELSEKEMFGGVAFLLAGNMAVGVHGEDLMVRVDPLQTEALLKEPGAKPFDLSGNRAPAGWLLVTPAGYRTDAALRAWVTRGIAYASSLPKKTTKKDKPPKK